MNEIEIAITCAGARRTGADARDAPQPGGPLEEHDIEGHTVASLVSPGTELAWILRAALFRLIRAIRASSKLSAWARA